MSQAADNNPTQDVFVQVLARPVAAPDLQHQRLVHLAWSAPHQGDRLVQVYVNGELRAASASPAHRELWLMIDRGVHVQIELLAVCPADAAAPMPELLSGAQPITQPDASFTLLRDYALPIDAALHVSIDSQPERQASALFAIDTPRGGFGAVFGEGGFGFDASTGPGLGRGELGYGPLGVDGEALRWRSDTLAQGAHELQLELLDRDGELAATALDLPISITRLPTPPSNVSLNPDLKLTWT